MSMFSNLKTEENVAEETDSIPVGRGPLESGLYPMTIDMAYADESKGGAMNVNFVFKDADGRELRQTIYVSSGDAKGKLPYYVDKDGNKKYLPGFNKVNHICLLTVGKELMEMDTDEKVLSLWDSEQRKEVPQKKQVLMDLLGQDIILGVQKQIEDKVSKNDQGAWVPTGETRETNEIDKVFRAKDKKTVAEIKAEVEEAQFINDWEEKWTGVTRDRTKKNSNTPKPAAEKKTTSSMFG